MKTNFKKGIKNSLPVYSKKYGYIRKENIHFENMSYRVGDIFYDVNGKGYNDYLYCKIPFFCTPITYYLSGNLFVILLAALITTDIFAIKCLGLIIMSCIFSFLLIHAQTLHLEKFKNKK